MPFKVKIINLIFCTIIFFILCCTLTVKEISAGTENKDTIELSNEIDNPKIGQMVHDDSSKKYLTSLQDSLLVIRKEIARSKLEALIIPLLTTLVAGLIGFGAAYYIYYREKKDILSRLANSSKVLADVLFNEAKDSVQRCCDIVEYQSYKIISRASFPTAARQHLMNQLSGITLEKDTLNKLTNIYNILDRIIVHQDKAIQLEGEGNKKQALEIQGRGVGFIRYYISDLVSLLQSMQQSDSIKEEIDKINKRHQLILRTQKNLFQYSAIAMMYRQMNRNNKLSKEETLIVLNTLIAEESSKTESITAAELINNMIQDNLLEEIKGDNKEFLSFSSEIKLAVESTIWSSLI